MYTRRELEEQIKNTETEILDLQIQIMTLQEKVGRANKKYDEIKGTLSRGEYKED